MATWIRRIVSGQKKRFQDDGFDLDLAYISPRIVAMGLPAERAEMLYRNPMPEIARFLHTYHKNHAKVYNLCSEHAYGPDKLLTALQHYPFDDHQTPALLVVQQFCEDAAAWLAGHAHNVVVVHCKAGKGRTGIMICCLLLYLHIHAPDLANVPAADITTSSNEAGSDAGTDTAEADGCSESSISSGGSSRGWHPWQTVSPLLLKELRNPVKDVLALYADQRTHDGNGVTIASQRRYVGYFWRWLSAGNTVPRRTVQLRELMITGLALGSADACSVVVEARPSGSTAASASRVLTCSQPQAAGSGSLQGLCLGPCTAEPLVCDDDSCCRVRVSSSTASDCLTISMPAASMGLSMIAAKHQQLEQHHQHMHHITAAAAAAAAANDAFMGVLPPEADTALQPSGCAADLGCSCMGGGCLGCGRLSAAVLPEPAPVPPCGITPAAAAGQLGNGSTAFESAMGVPDEAVGGETAEGSDGIGGGELDPSELGDLRGCCVVEGDVRVLVMRGSTRLFYTWFNTAYLPDSGCYSLSKSQLDKPNKLLPDDVRLTVRFVDMQPHVEVEEGEAPAGGSHLQPPPAQSEPEQPLEDGVDSELSAKTISASSGWSVLRNRVLRSSKSSRSSKKPGNSAAGRTARSTGSHQQQAGRGVDDPPVLSMMAGAAADGALAAGTAASAGGSDVLQARRPAPLILTSSSSLSALSSLLLQGCGHDQEHQQSSLHNCLSAPATPQAAAEGGGGVAQLALNGSWSWQHLPAISGISSISSTFWDWAAAAAGSEECAADQTVLGGMSSMWSQDKLSWDWDWSSLASVVPAAAVSNAAAVSVVDAVAARTTPPPLMKPHGSSAAPFAPASPASSWATSRLQVGLQLPDPLPGGVPWKAKKPVRTRISLSATPMMQDQLSSLSRSPAAIELPLLPKHGLSKASSTVDALLDPAMPVAAASAAASPHAVLNGQQSQQQQQTGSPFMAVRGSAVHNSKLGRARKPFSLWQQLWHQTHCKELAQSGDAAVDVAHRAGQTADQHQPPAAGAGLGSCRAVRGRSKSFDATVGRSEAPSDAPSAAAAPVCDADGECALGHVDMCDPLLEAALPAAGADGSGSDEPLQDLLEALNWSTNGSKQSMAVPSLSRRGSHSSLGSSGGSCFQPRRRHTYSGQATKGGSSRPNGISKMHSAPCSPGQQQQEESARTKGPRERQARPRAARLLDLEAVDDAADDEVDGAGVARRLWVPGLDPHHGSSAAAQLAAAGTGGAAQSSAGTAQQHPCCLECVFDLHTGPCPAAGAGACTTGAAAAVPTSAPPDLMQPKVLPWAPRCLEALRDPAPCAPCRQLMDSELRDADAAVLACRQQLPAEATKGGRNSSSGGSGGGGGGSKTAPLVQSSTTPNGSPSVAAVGKRKSCNASSHNSNWGGSAGVMAGLRCRGDAEQLRSLLAAEDDSDALGTDATAEGHTSGGGSGGAASLTQQWKQLEKAWQRNWWV